MIVRDGEGATKVAEIRVTGTANDDDAHRIAETIATSPLFKTALAGGDANWGRIVAAAGRAGIPFDPQQTSLTITGPGLEPLTIFADGMPTSYEEGDAAAIFAQTDILIHLNVGLRVPVRIPCGPATSPPSTSPLTPTTAPDL